MQFRVFRDGILLGEVETSKNEKGRWAPVDTVDIKKGNIFESISDGARLEVVYNQLPGYIREGIQLRLIE